MASRPPSERTIVSGQTESGKTAFLIRHFLSAGRAPRLLIVDRTGEWFRKEPHAPSAIGLPDTVRMLDELAKKKQWRLIVSLSNEEVGQLANALVGIPDVSKGYSYNVGGMGLVVSEVDLLVPVSGASEAMRSLWRRGSHAGLSIYADTQRPANVSKETTSQCRWHAFLALYERNDVKYIIEELGANMAPRAIQWVQSTQYAAALFDRRRRVCHLVDPHGSIRDSLSDGPKPSAKPLDSGASPE